MSKKTLKIWFYAMILIISTMSALGQEEILQSNSLNKIVDVANKIGIPLASEQLSNPNVFFRTYGFTITISFIALTALLLLIHKIPSISHHFTDKFVKAGREIRYSKQNIRKDFISSLSSIKRKTGEKLHEIKERREKKAAAKLKEEKERRKLKEEAMSKKATDYKQIKAKFKKMPKDSADIVKLEVVIARKIEDEQGKFSVTDILKKIDELYLGELTRQDRINHYESIRRWTTHGELCQEAGKEKNVKYFKFI